MSSVEDDFSDIRSLAAYEGGSLSSGSLTINPKGIQLHDDGFSEQQRSASRNR